MTATYAQDMFGNLKKEKKEEKKEYQTKLKPSSYEIIKEKII